MKQPLERPMKQPQERPQEWPMKQPRQRPRRDHPNAALRGAGRQSRWSGQWKCRKPRRWGPVRLSRMVTGDRGNDMMMMNRSDGGANS